MCDDRELQALLDEFSQEEQCAWCGDSDRRLQGKAIRLCGSCQNIKRLIRKCERMKGQSPFAADELATARRMEKMAKAERTRFGSINQKNIDGVDLQLRFNEVARIAIHRDLPYCDASVFGQHFTLAQRRFLAYLLSTMVRIHERRHRKITAAYAAD